MYISLNTLSSKPAATHTHMLYDCRVLINTDSLILRTNMLWNNRTVKVWDFIVRVKLLGNNHIIIIGDLYNIHIHTSNRDL